MMIPGKTIPNKTYSYGDFYVTSDFESAVEYSNNPGGEYVFWAYCNVVGLKDFDIEVPDEVKKAMELLENEYPKFESSERVVAAITGFELKDLLTEGGEKLHIDEESFESLYLDDQAYRIINFEKYRDQITIIPEQYFYESTDNFLLLFKDFSNYNHETHYIEFKESNTLLKIGNFTFLPVDVDVVYSVQFKKID